MFTSLLSPLRPLAFAGALVLAVGLSPQAEASVLVPLDTRALVERAERIVVGVVEGQTSRWLDESRTTIVTDVRIRVQRAMLGAQPGEVITVRRLGGTVDGIGMRVHGEASYTQGEEVLVFTERRGASSFAVGMAQGKMHVATEDGRRVVRVDLGGAELLGPGVAVTAQPAGPRPLEDLIRDIQSLVAQKQKKQKVQP
jgi:hypothetical protein